MPDQCDNCSYSRPRTYGSKQVLECRHTPPVAQGQIGHWPECQPTDWCGEYEPHGAEITDTYINGTVALTSTTRAKLMDVGGDSVYTVAAMFGCQITNLANQAVVVFFYDGDTTNMIAQAGSVANGSNEVSFSYPPVARSGKSGVLLVLP